MSPRARRLLPWIALFIIYVVWGSTYLAIAVVVRELPAFAAGSLRFLIAGLIMAAVAAVVDRSHGWPSRRQLADYALVGMLLLGVGNGMVMWSEKSIPSGIAALIVATVPLWLTLLDGLRPDGQPWTVRAWLGGLIGLVGVALVARPGAGVPGGHWVGRPRPAGCHHRLDGRLAVRAVRAAPRCRWPRRRRWRCWRAGCCCRWSRALPERTWPVSPRPRRAPGAASPTW